MPKRLHLPIPLLRQLHEISGRIEAKFPADFDHGLGQLGLLLDRKLVNGGYYSTPANSLQFAATGGDGTHFSLIEIDGGVSERSPVVMTVPANTSGQEEDNAIVGADLTDFLRLGLRRGYFGLEQLVYRREITLETLASNGWEAPESLRCTGLDLDERKIAIMQMVANELGVTPLVYSPCEFEELQRQYMPLLKYHPENYLRYPTDE